MPGKKGGEKSDAELLPGVIVWAKLVGFSPWPSVIADLDASSPDALRALKEAGKGAVLVQFFGDHTYSPVRNDKACLRAFRCELFGKFSAGRSAGFKKALAAAIEAEKSNDREVALTMARGPVQLAPKKSKSKSSKSSSKSSKSKKSKSKSKKKKKSSHKKKKQYASSSDNDDGNDSDVSMHDDDDDDDSDFDVPSTTKKKSKKRARPSSSDSAKQSEAKRQRSAAAASRRAEQEARKAEQDARIAEKMRRREERQRIRIERATAPVPSRIPATQENLNALELSLVHGIKTIGGGDGARELVETLAKLRRYDVTFELLGRSELGKLVRRISEQDSLDDIYGGAITAASKELFQRYLNLARAALEARTKNANEQESKQQSKSVESKQVDESKKVEERTQVES
jgi:PWWP domain